MATSLLVTCSLMSWRCRLQILGIRALHFIHPRLVAGEWHVHVERVPAGRRDPSWMYFAVMLRRGPGSECCRSKTTFTIPATRGSID